MGSYAKGQFNIKFTDRLYAGYRNFAVCMGVFLISFFIAGALSPTQGSNALPCTNTEDELCDTAGTDVSVTIENPYFVNIASSHGSAGSPIALDYTKSEVNVGNLLTVRDNVKVSTNAKTNHYLYISTNSSSNNLTSTDTDLSNSHTYIAPGGGDTLASASALTANTWGLSLEESSANNSFTKVPILGKDLLLDTSNQEESETDVYYGVLATSELSPGKYSNTIKYTAYVEPLADDMEVSPVQVTEFNQTISFKVPSFISSIDKVGEVSVDIGNWSCPGAEVANVDVNYTTITCKAPWNGKGSTYTATLTFKKYGKTITKANAISYSSSTTSPTISSCSELGTYGVGKLYGYEVYKLPDGKCWMTGDYQNSTFYYERISCPSRYTGPNEAIYKALLSATGGRNGARGLNALGWNSNYYYWVFQSDHSVKSAISESDITFHHSNLSDIPEGAYDAYQAQWLAGSGWVTDRYGAIYSTGTPYSANDISHAVYFKNRSTSTLYYPDKMSARVRCYAN